MTLACKVSDTNSHIASKAELQTVNLLPDDLDLASPQPIVLDPRLRFPTSLRMLSEWNGSKGKSKRIRQPWIICGKDVDRERIDTVEQAGARVIAVALNNGRPLHTIALQEEDPSGIGKGRVGERGEGEEGEAQGRGEGRGGEDLGGGLTRSIGRVSPPGDLPSILSTLSIKSVMIEGGSAILSSFLHSPSRPDGTMVVDAVVVTVAPTFIGDGVGIVPDVSFYRYLIWIHC